MHSKGISTNFIAFLNAFSLHKFAVAARKKKARICWLRLKSSSQTFLQLFLKQTLFSKLFSYPRFSRREFYLQTFVCGRINTYSEGFEWNPKVLFGKKDFFPRKGYFIKRKGSKQQKRYDRFTRNLKSFSCEEATRTRRGATSWWGKQSFLITNILGKVNQKIWWKNGRQKVFPPRRHQKQIRASENI